MSSITFDTLAYTKKLKAAGVSQDQAEVQADALLDLFNKNNSDLTTKNDLDSAVKDINSSILQLESRILRAILTTMISITAIFAAIVKLF